MHKKKFDNQAVQDDLKNDMRMNKITRFIIKKGV